MRNVHLTEDEIEKYALVKLPKSETVYAQEHLLACHQCRDELELLGLIISGLREELFRPGLGA